MKNTVILQVKANRGYLPYQITEKMSTMTLGQMLELAQDAVDNYGEDALLVIADPDNQYGAAYGGISPRATITSLEEEEDY